MWGSVLGHCWLFVVSSLGRLLLRKGLVCGRTLFHMSRVFVWGGSSFDWGGVGLGCIVAMRLKFLVVGEYGL